VEKLKYARDNSERQNSTSMETLHLNLTLSPIHLIKLIAHIQHTKYAIDIIKVKYDKYIIRTGLE